MVVDVALPKRKELPSDDRSGSAAVGTGVVIDGCVGSSTIWVAVSTKESSGAPVAGEDPTD